MTGTSLIALLDDIASTLDDVALMTKVAAKKTAGVLGDDLALNAEQVLGLNANRELPVVWAVAKGSFVNKLILVPLALSISWVFPPLVMILLMFGGFYLCYEGVEKIFEKFLHKGPEFTEENLYLQDVDIHQFEKEKIKGAVRTDFVLSAEIIVITLGTVAHMTLGNQITVLTIISIIMTVGVYGFVACIVKLDDLGFILREKKQPIKQIGLFLISSAPLLMKLLAVVGTIAMFLVGGGIIVHGIPLLHHYINTLPSMLYFISHFIIGIIAGVFAALIVFILNIIKTRFFRKKPLN